MKNHFSFTAAAMFFLFLAFTVHTEAGTLTTTMPISVQISGGCSLSATGINFGNYAAGPSAPALTATGTISVTCPSSLPYKVSLNSGTAIQNGVIGPNGPVVNRAMTFSNNEQLGYELYKDAARTTIWGDSDLANTYPNGSSQSGTGIGANQTLTVFGLVPGGQLISAPTNASGTDTITVTLLF
ncbi:spore coat U domain-containing protein [Nitrospira sp. BLG_1]|uniref:Csu type fimbrial protein n=1 Tax=Nitrospira sp. BLG_1 TaxID=3395883 RepID=UPI0039BD21A4